jgi:hypothetical protein
MEILAHLTGKQELSEIPSTIDLIMQRTKGMSLSKQERDDLNREELRKRAKGLKLKLTEDSSRATEILSSLKDESSENQKILVSFLWEFMLDELAQNEEFSKYMDLLEKLPGAQDKIQILNRLRSAHKSQVKDQQENKKKIVAQEKKKLAAWGISGSAAIPKLPKTAAEDDSFHQLLDTCRKELLAAL